MLTPDHVPSPDAMLRYQLMGKLLEKAEALGAPLVVKFKDGEKTIYRRTYDDSQADITVAFPFTPEMVQSFIDLNPDD